MDEPGEKKGLAVRLEPPMTVEEYRAALMRAAIETFGEDRANAVRGRLERTAEWLARIASEPIEVRGDSPDLSGQEDAAGGRS